MIVYKAICIHNNKIYIGATTNSLCKRKSSHLYSARNGSKYAFHNAIRSHGYNSFIWDIMAYTDTKQQMFQLEKLYILLYDSKNSGYNMTDGGETPNAMYGKDNPMYGRTHSDKVKQRLRDIHSGIKWDDKFGKERSNEIKHKLSLAHSGRKNTATTIKKMIKNNYWKNNGHLIIGTNNPNYGNYWDETKKDKVRGSKNGMYGVRRFGEQNPMHNKKHTDSAREKMCLSQKGRGNGNYRSIDNKKLKILLNTFNDTGSIAESARCIGENYNKAKRELIIEGVITKHFKQQA